MPEINLSSSCVKAALHSGNHAVYELRPEHLNPQHFNVLRGPDAGARLLTRNEIAISYGNLIAVKNGQDWHDKRSTRPAWSCRIVDRATVAALDACQAA